MAFFCYSKILKTLFVKMAVLHGFFMPIGNCLCATNYMLAMLGFNATCLPTIFSFSFLQFPSLRYLLFYTVIKLATRKKESNADCSKYEKSKFRKSSCQNNPELKYYSSRYLFLNVKISMWKHFSRIKNCL